MAPKEKQLTKGQKNLKKDIIKSIRGQKEPRLCLQSITATSVTFSGLMSGALLVAAQGNAYNQRDGDVTTHKHIKIRATIGVGSTSNIVRCILVKWLVSNETEVPTVADIVDTEGNYVGNSRCPLADINFHKINNKKFVVLKDKTWHLDQSNTVKTFNWTVKPRGKTYWSGTYSSGNLYLCTLSDDGAATYPYIAYVSEVQFLP